MGEESAILVPGQGQGERVCCCRAPVGKLRRGWEGGGPWEEVKEIPGGQLVRRREVSRPAERRQGALRSGGQKAAVDERLVASGWPREKSLGGLSIDTGQSPRAERAC